jgi:exodeoxyribonuclease VII large subunit
MFKKRFPSGTTSNGLYHRAMMDETPLSDVVEAPLAQANLREFTVSELSNLLKRAVEESFPYVRVKGELSRVSRHSSGHCYFDLKDDRAVIAAVIWKGSFARIKVKPEQGLEVVCTGRLTTFPGQSKYQIVVEEMALAGLGALMAMLDARKKKLAAEGLFDVGRKKPIPFLPRVVGVVTSPTGAVIRDIMHRLSDRCPRRVVLWPVNVQGDRAAGEIAAAIRGFNALPWGGPIPRPDVLIIARGGGSFEDLLAFSDEDVVRAVAGSEIPLISAVGHETDTTLIDFAADKRAPTPTAAAEMAVPVLRDCVDNLGSLHRRLSRAASRAMERQRRHLQALVRALPRPDSLFALPRQRFDSSAGRLRVALFQNLQRHAARLAHASALMRPRLIAAEVQRERECVADFDLRLMRAFRQRVIRSQASLEASVRVLDSLSYRAVLARGFALVRGADGALKRRASAVKPAEALTLAFSDGEAKATAAGTAPPRPKAMGLFRGKGQGDLF